MVSGDSLKSQNLSAFDVEYCCHPLNSDNAPSGQKQDFCLKNEHGLSESLRLAVNITDET